MKNAHWISGLFLEHWLEAASLDLHRRISAEHSDARCEYLDPGAWIDALRIRLAGIVTQVIVHCPEITEQQIESQFPVLSALLNDAISEWTDSVVVFDRRLRCDAPRIAMWLGYQNLPELVSASPASADLHDGAQAAMRLVFGDGACIYYKPRPVTGEWLWDRLVHAANGHSSLQLASAQALAGSDGQYGWVASLPNVRLHSWDKDSGEASRYWEAAGATLCLAEHVRMTDLHMANVMATPTGPALFDTETLGTPQASYATPPGLRPETDFAAAMDDLLDTGLLPRPTSSELPDTSGLFGKATAVPHIMIPRWSSRPDGTRRVEMAPAALLDQGNMPHPASPLQVLPPLVSGYREAANALIHCRENLVAPGSAWRWTLEHHHAPRIILRDTLTYCVLLSRSLQPKRLSSALHRRAALRRALRVSSDRLFPPAVMRAEAEALLHLHIPRFTALPGSRTLAGNSGQALAPSFLLCSPSEAVLRKISVLTQDHLTKIQIPSLLAMVFGRAF